MLEAHGHTIYQETLEALWLVKDELSQVGGMFNFDITCSPLDEVKLSRSRYKTDRIEKKHLKRKNLHQRKESLKKLPERL